MRFIAFIVVILTVAPYSANSQEVAPHQYTMLPADARFAIVQSQLAAKWTFRLDRFSGEVFQLVKTFDDSNVWEQMEVVGLPRVSTPLRPHFQIFTSGSPARHTFRL